MQSNTENDLDRWNIASKEYDSIQKDSGDPNRQLTVNPIVLKLAGEIKNKKILDAGCGNGYFSQKLRELGSDVISIDGSRELVELAKKNFPDQTILISDLNQPLPFANQEFDIIFCLMVIQYLEDPLTALQEFQRTAKRNGKIIIVIPHPCFAYPATITKRGIIGRITKNHLITKVADYLHSKRIETSILGMENKVTRYHRTLEEYSKLFSLAGLRITSIVEPADKKLKNIPTVMIVELANISE